MDGVEAVIEEIRRGGIVIVTDDEDRENEGDLIMAADAVTTDLVAFFLRHTAGVMCVALTGDQCDRLDLSPMVARIEDPNRTAFTVSTDIATAATGISAAERADTVRALADSQSRPSQFVRPGHVFPLRARQGGVLKRAGHTEAAVDLARMAGRTPAGFLCEIVTADKTGMARGPELEVFARDHRLPMTSVAALVRHRLRVERLLEPIAQARLPTRYGEFSCHAWRSVIDGTEHLALSLGDVTGPDPVLVRVHSECLTGDVFGSWRCDCGPQLADAMEAIRREKRGVVVYLRGHEGRGIGLGHKLAAYNLQDAGLDTVDANLALGLPADSREYGLGAQILMELGVTRMRLLTNNPAKYSGLEGFGLEITERVALPPRQTSENCTYLATKRERMGHLL